MLRNLLLSALLCALAPLSSWAQGFVQTSGQSLSVDGKPFTVVSVTLEDSLWRIAHNDRTPRLAASLRQLKAAGINTLRISLTEQDKKAFSLLFAEAEKAGMYVIAELPDYILKEMRAWASLRVGKKRLPLSAHPSLLSWEIVYHDYEAGEALYQQLKALDTNHLIAFRTEGLQQFDNSPIDGESFFSSYSDYLTLALHPLTWQWTSPDRTYDALSNVYLRSDEYIERNARLARSLNKPLVLTATEYPRDRNGKNAHSSTLARDAYFSYVRSKSISREDDVAPLAGIGFSSWAGSYRPDASQSVSCDYIFDTDASFSKTAR